MNKPNEQPKEIPTRVMLEINLQPALPIQDVQKLAKRAEREGCTLEALIIRGIGQFLETEPSSAAA
jgi:hypothetical protein